MSPWTGSSMTSGVLYHYVLLVYSYLATAWSGELVYDLPPAGGSAGGELINAGGTTGTWGTSESWISVFHWNPKPYTPPTECGGDAVVA